jgi:VanZ family protein
MAKQSWRVWILPLLWMGVIFLLSSQSDFGPVGRIAFPQADKVAHFFLYAILGLLLGRAALRGELRRGAWLAFLIGVVYGGTDEIHQAFVPRRTPDLMDFLVDVISVAVGVLLARRLFRRLK